MLSDQVRMIRYVLVKALSVTLERKVISELLFDSTSNKKRRQDSGNELIFHTEKLYNHFIRRLLEKYKSCWAGRNSSLDDQVFEKQSPI